MEPYKNYVSSLLTISPEATELSYRAALSNLVSQISRDYSLISEPKSESRKLKIDMRAFKKSRKVGYIETKDIGINLDRVLESEQLSRYVSSVQNLILTDYLEFRLVRNGTTVMSVKLLSELPKSSKNVRVKESDAEELTNLFNSFFQYQVPQIKKAADLAKYLAGKARLLKFLSSEDVSSALAEKNANTSVKDFVMLIRPLLGDAAPSEYVDAYSQTITFGILLAKSVKQSEVLTRENAAKNIPSSVRIIRRILLNIIDPSLPDEMGWVIDDIFDIVNASDLSKVLVDIKEKTGAKQEAFLLFYEYFLENYDPEKRKKHGVYYTPRPVVSFIVNNVNRILISDFGKQLGLGNDDVTIMDPSTGTGTFLAMSYLIALLTIKRNGYGGIMKDKITNHLLKDFYGFELLVAPYVLAHLKLTTELDRTWFYELSNEDRVQVYLTNTLQTTDIKNLYAFDEILQESKIASEIKDKKHLLVILGNPPYSAFSQNKGGFIEKSLKTGYSLPNGINDPGYYTVDGHPLNERNPKWLLDDYVKFVRYGQWKIDQNGEGIVAYITNNGFLDNPTFRGMRQSLLSTFDNIYVVNLHGSGRKNESRMSDENVFGILQGVSITFFIKKKSKEEKKVKYLDLFGTKDYKFKWLDQKSILDLEWVDVSPTKPQYLFVPHKSDSSYSKLRSIKDIFTLNSVGIATARDHFTISMDETTLKERIEKFITMDPEDARLVFNLGKDAKDWKVKSAQKDILDSGFSTESVVRILYRPFDYRYTYYTGKSSGFLCRPRPEVMKNMMKNNIALIVTRGSRPEPWRDILVGDRITDIALLSSNTSRSSYCFPLYVQNEDGRSHNVSLETIEFLRLKYDSEVSPESIFYFVYGILYSRRYRDVYSDDLLRDFPRIPFPDSKKEYDKVVNLGREMAEVHLMKVDPEVKLNYPIGGSNRVTKVSYKDGKIYINESQYFEGASKEIWEFKVGSYRVLEKWLKSHLRMELHSADIEHFSKVAGLLAKTIEIIEDLDEAVDFIT